ncbi:MAG: VOC family protein [Candidatus Binatia bacterium]
MPGAFAHVGITVSDMDRAVRFYRDTLGLTMVGDVTFAGDEADTLTGEQQVKLRAVYFRSPDDQKGAPIELLHFVEPQGGGKPYERLTNPGITEVAFWVKDIEETYADLRAKGVSFYSAPQLFELDGYRVKAVYFRDPDGTTLELIQRA